MAYPTMWAVAPATGGSAPGCLPPCVSSWEKSERGALFFSGTTGGGPKWDQVIWRRTVDANGTVIEDIGVNFCDRRTTLFRRLPRRSGTKTTFWYCDDAEVALSWRKKYFPKGPGREPLRVKIPDLPDVFVVSIENDNTGRVVNRCREAGYSHPNAIKFPSRKRIAREVQSALIRAAAVHAQVLLDNDEDIDTNPGDVRGHRVVRKPKYTQKVAAPVGYSGVRWLVDTGCPMDLVGLGDLQGPDRALVAKGGHTHALHTANGATCTAGRVDADVGNLDEVIEAHVLESTPSIISVGKRCMDMGYSFVWTAGCRPTLTCPSGRTVTLDVINNVPYLPHGDTQFVSPTLDDAEPLPAMPAPGAAYKGLEASEVPPCRSGLTAKSELQDTWRTERSGHVVKEHRLPRKAKFMPTDDDCPVGVDRLDNYGKTVVHRNGVTHEVLVDNLWELSERDQHAVASDVPWTGETWFQVKCEAVALPGKAEQGGEGDSRPPPFPGPGEGDDDDIVEISFLSGLRTEAEWRADAKTLRHMLTHLPKNPYCPHCQRAKMENVKLRRKGGAAAHDVVSFGDLTTADTMVLRGLKDRGFHGEADAIVFYDLATDYLEVLPVQSRSRSNTLEAFRRFAGGQTLKLVYSDQAPELKNAVTTLGALHRLSTPGMPKTNGLIENKVKLVLHGARVLLRQAGFEPRWWPFAVRHFSMARNIENRGEGSPWMRRHGNGNFSGVILPFGCLVDFYPIAPKIRRDRKGGVQNAQNDSRQAGKIENEGGDHWIANEDEKVLTRVHVEARTELFIPIGTSCPVKIRDLGRRRSTVLNYLDGSTEFVVDENWLQAENDRGGNHEWTGETHFDCDFDQIDEDGAEIYENEGYEPECNDEPNFVPIDEVEVEETSVTTALPAEKKERDFIKIEEDPKFAPSSKPGLFLGYRLEPGGLWKGDYLVADLEHIQRGLRKPSIHQVKRIWKNPEEPYVFPMLASYDARTRTIREALADRRADMKPSKKIRDEFDFDEGRFDDPDDDDDDHQDEGGGSSSKSDGAIQSKAVQGSGDACVSDYWERHDEDSAWYRIHVEVRKKFFGTTNEDLPPGGPSHEELDTVRVTHMRGLDAVGNWVRDDRHHDAPNHRHFTRGFWTGVTILFDKGCAPHGRFKPKEEGAELAGGPKKGHKLHGDRIDYGQSADRRERPYAGTGKPNSIDADSWRQMSTRSREIYVQTERELSLREERRREHPERDPAAPAPGRKLLIEFACEPDSRLSAVMMECGGDAIRVHIGSFDITKAKDVSRLIGIIEDNPGCDLWGSIPCGPWSTWQYVNLSIHGAEFASHLNDLRRNSQVMFAAFLRASRAVRRGGGRVAFEWPRHCLGWKQPFMQRFLADPDVETVDFDGCDFGMQDKDGVPIRKQWKVATTSKELIDKLSGQKCKHEKGYLHARIEGSVTPTTALYPSEMCEAIVGAWYPNGTFKKVANAMPVEVDSIEQRWKKRPNTLYVNLNSETAKIPTRATSGSAGLDTYASEGVSIPAGGSGLVSTGISIEMPAGVYARIAPRSGLAVKNRIARSR